ncbi:carbon storage regulator, partial [Pirellulaceae bacterium]|nr:carbon storage regulator [Pirellulaceae bacterium]
MLVLSRQQDQKVLFPNLGITVEIVSIKGRNVKLGIDAPPAVRIIREELADEWDFKQREMAPYADPLTKSGQPSSNHALKKQLEQIGHLVQVAQEKLTKGQVNDAIEHVESALTNLSNLDQSIECEPAEVVREQTKKYVTQLADSNGHDKASLSNNSTHKWKALLVEGDAKERKLITKALGSSGITVNVANNDEEAIAFLTANETPDFVLIDMESPKITGSEAIEFIRENDEFSDLPIYGVSRL